MTCSTLPAISHLPDVWGEGAIFAFSGLDGPTASATGFVATLTDRPYGLLIDTPCRRLFEIIPSDTGYPAYRHR